jgi:hypothetical protein
VPASDRWIRLKLGMTVRAIREDRILYEAMATGGDERRLGDLFGLSVKGATRYTAVIDHSASPNSRHPSSTGVQTGYVSAFRQRLLVSAENGGYPA